MVKQLEQRLKELKSEFETGQKRLVELETQQASLRDTLLRISGAIQVLEEELGKNGKDEHFSKDNAIATPKRKQQSELVSEQGN